jgi:hypothetical protein
MDSYRPYHSRLWRAGILLLACVLLAALYSTSTARPGSAAERADVAVTLWPTPSLRVTRGSIIAYDIRAKNFGEGEADRVEVTLPYDPQTLTLLDAFFDDNGAWVSAVDRDSVEVTFLDVDKNEEHTGTLLFRVADTVPNGAVISMWAHFGWENDREDEEGKLSNAAPVLVGDSEKTEQHIVLMVDPEHGPSGTIYTFFSDRFGPNEKITGWLNTTVLPEELELDLETDSTGRVQLAFSSHDLPPGPYSLVLYGNRSGLTGVGAFLVDTW